MSGAEIVTAMTTTIMIGGDGGEVTTTTTAGNDEVPSLPFCQLLERYCVIKQNSAGCT